MGKLHRNLIAIALITSVLFPDILCPLAQPNKAIGLESHIGSWLAGYLVPTVLLAQLHEPEASNHHRKMKPRRQNPQLAESRSRNMRLAHSVGLDAMRTASPHRGARESFSLDIPSHRMSGLVMTLPEPSERRYNSTSRRPCGGCLGRYLEGLASKP
jgi:hypothetical protein